jgi:hypothetical protein
MECGDKTADGGVAVSMGDGAVSMGVIMGPAVGAMAEGLVRKLVGVPKLALEPRSLCFVVSHISVNSNGLFHSKSAGLSGHLVPVSSMQWGCYDGFLVTEVGMEVVSGLGTVKPLAEGE